MPDPLRHEALPYAGHDAFVSSCVSLAQEALTRDQRMILLAEEAKVADVRDALGPDAEDITFVPTDQHGRNPNRVMTMLDSFQATSNGRRSLGINESISATRSPLALAEAQFADSVLNAAAVQAWSLDVLCMFDTTVLDAPSLTEMRRSHPFVRGQDSNPDYVPDLATSLFAAALDGGPDEVVILEIDRPELAEMRRLVRGYATGQGIDHDRVEDLALAANEVVTNSLRHGGGSCRLTVWSANSSVVCEVSDSGHITDPLAGRLAPPPSATSGRGLWLANHLCDLVQIRSSEAGTVVRLFMDRL
jgi:anti-sigma regulatory factor (Ser/Thr protein kinase)